MVDLDPLQRKVLDLLRGMEPAWTLTGGGALVGFYLHHRRTRDLDLFFHGLRVFGSEAEEAVARLRAAGLRVSPTQTSPSFRQLLVEDGEANVVVDLVAEPVPVIEEPRALEPGILVDTPHEILVNKLCALLGRQAIRDLVDVQALLEAGGDLERAVRDAPRKDGGFSPPTLAWLIQDLPVERLTWDSGYDTKRLLAFREDLVRRLLR